MEGQVYDLPTTIQPTKPHFSKIINWGETAQFPLQGAEEMSDSSE